MVDIAFGPTPGPRPDMNDPRSAYMEMLRRKRMYGGILLVLFIAMLASGWILANERNAGGFWDGRHQIFAFPAEVFSEAWRDRAHLPAIFIEHIPALIETLNIAAVSTLIGALFAGRWRCWPRAGWRVGPV